MAGDWGASEDIDNSWRAIAVGWIGELSGRPERQDPKIRHMRQQALATAVEAAKGLRVSGVTHRYRAGEPVLQDVSVELEAGRITALVGPNGAGKTTLLRVMAGLIVPTAGSAMLSGDAIGAMRPAARARRVAYLPQRGGVAFGYTAREVVAMGAVGETDASGDRVERALDRVGLAEAADRVYDELSGGQRQRVRLARVMLQAGRPEAGAGGALLLDEPVAGLDPAFGESTMAELTRWAAAGWAVAVVLHDVALACRWADRAVVMDAGRVVATGQAEAVLTETRLSDVYGVAFAKHVNDATGRAVLLPTWETLGA
ncbi:MAG: ABC transporter ATP-binding protein [Planctomycetota bacterium]